MFFNLFDRKAPCVCIGRILQQEEVASSWLLLGFWSRSRPPQAVPVQSFGQWNGVPTCCCLRQQETGQSSGSHLCSQGSRAYTWRCRHFRTLKHESASVEFSAPGFRTFPAFFMWSLAEFQTLRGLVTSLGPGAQPPATKTLHALNYGLISSWCQMLLPIRGLVTTKTLILSFLPLFGELISNVFFLLILKRQH